MYLKKHFFRDNIDFLQKIFNSPVHFTIRGAIGGL